MLARILLIITLQLVSGNVISQPFNGRFYSKGSFSSQSRKGQSALQVQVLNQPKHGLSLPFRQNSPTQIRSPNTGKLETPTRSKSPLLDFPDPLTTPAPVPEERLLDFPEPTISSRNYKEQCALISKRTRKTEALGREVPVRRNRVRQAISLQNRQLLQYFVSRAIEDTLPVSDHEPIFGFQLLNKTVEIFKTLCSGKYVSVKFIDSNLRLFKQLYHLTSPGRTEYLNKKAFDWIHRLLDKCHSQVGQPLKYFMDQCSEEIVSYNTETNWVCPPLKDAFNPSKHDVLLDIIWHMYNAVQSYCFTEFHESYRMFHKYGMAITDIFTTPIKARWNYNGDEFEKGNFPLWEQLFGPHYQIFLRNIERCTHAIRITSEMPARRPRYTLPGSLRLSYNRTALTRTAASVPSGSANATI